MNAIAKDIVLQMETCDVWEARRQCMHVLTDFVCEWRTMFAAWSRVLQRNIRAQEKITLFLQESTNNQTNAMRLYQDSGNLLKSLDPIITDATLRRALCNMKLFLEQHCKNVTECPPWLTLAFMNNVCNVMDILNECVDKWALQ